MESTPYTGAVFAEELNLVGPRPTLEALVTLRRRGGYPMRLALILKTSSKS